MPVLAGKNRLVACFSVTGHTERVAQWAAQQTGAGICRITPEIPYTRTGLNYRNPASRAAREQNDPPARGLPARSKISGEWTESMTVPAKNAQDTGRFNPETKTVLLNSGQ